MQVGIAGYTPAALDAARRWLSAGIEVVVWDRDPELLARFPIDDQEGAVRAGSIPDLVSKLAPLRRVFLFGDRAADAEATIRGLAAQLEISDIVVDASSCPHEQADFRMELLAQPRARYVGLGRFAPKPDSFDDASLMLGGHRVGAEAASPALSCLVPKERTAYLGTGGAAQLVASLMEALVGMEATLLSELVRLCLLVEPKSGEEVASCLAGWGQHSSDSPMVAALAAAVRNGDMAASPAEAQSRLQGTPSSAAEIVVGLRTIAPAFLAVNAPWEPQISQKERDTNVSRYPRPNKAQSQLTQASSLWDDARQAFAGCRILSAIQLVLVLNAASRRLAYGIHIGDTIRLIRGSALLQSQAFEPILTALSDPHGANLLVYPRVQFVLAPLVAPLRRVVASSALLGMPAPVCSACLNYFDSMTIPSSSAYSAASLLETLRTLEPAGSSPASKRPGA